MSVDNATPTHTGHETEELDELFTVLADWRRRIVVDHLTREGAASVESLAEQLASTDDSLALFEAKIALLHDQLPRLEEAGVVAFDREERHCELTETRRTAILERLLTAVGAED